MVLVRRDTGEKEQINLDFKDKKNFDGLFCVIEDRLEKMQKDMFERGKKFVNENTFFCDNLKDFEKNVKLKKKILVPWFDCGISEKKIKEKYGVKTSCIPIEFNKKIFENYDLPDDLKNFEEKNLEKYNCFFDSEKKANCFVYFSRSH